MHVPTILDFCAAVFMGSELPGTALGEDRVAEEMVVAGVGIDHDERQPGFFPHRVQELAALTGPQPVSIIPARSDSTIKPEFSSETSATST